MSKTKIVSNLSSPEYVHPCSGGIFTDNTNATDINHDISVVGYGEENGQKYWVIRNSWGTYWGENGFFRLARGVNNLGIESEGTCSWATPKDTWSDIVFPQKEYKVGVKAKMMQQRMGH